MLFNRKAQSTAEYAIIIGVVVGAIMAVGVFLRGGIEAKVRDMTNRYLKDVGVKPEGDYLKTQVMQTSYTTESKVGTEVKMGDDKGEGASASASVIYVGGATKDKAENEGKTTRYGTTTYFGN